MFRALGTLCAVAVVIVMIAGYMLARSSSFKEECTARKITGQTTGNWFKNVVCDADFTIKGQ